MSTLIRVTCPTCHSNLDNPAGLRVMVSAADPNHSYYQFECGSCGTVRKPAPPTVVQLLIHDGGVRPMVFDLPRLDPITIDEITAFVFALGETDYLCDVIA